MAFETIEYTKSLEMAEDAILQYFAFKLGSTEGKDCFKGKLPEIVNAWSFDIGGEFLLDHRSCNLNSIHTQGNFTAIYSDRKSLQRLIMGIMETMPIVNLQNVIKVFPNSIPRIEAITFKLLNDVKQERIFFKVEIPFTLVFSTKEASTIEVT